jgi:hypothetical protein
MKANKFTAADKTTVIDKMRDRSGAIYLKMVDGSIRCEKRRRNHSELSGKSWRRLVIRQRRADREAAKENAK